MCRVVIDDHHHSTRVRSVVRSRIGSGLVKQFAQSRHLLDSQFRSTRALEYFTDRADHEGEFIPSLWLNLA
jgi:hypothetical protein